MKKKIIIIALILVSVFVLLITVWLMFSLELGITQNNCPETFLSSSTSPDGDYTLEAYKTEPGATVDFSIKVYIVNGNKKELIYNAYHEYYAEITWVGKSKVSINGKILELSDGETYDWRNKQSY